MRCPACRSELVVVEREGVELDWCPFCRGLWFDAGELEAVEATLGVSFRPLAGQRSAGKRRCPRCDAAMDTLKLEGSPSLIADVCPKAHGIWFDAGELAALAAGGGGRTEGDAVTFLGEKLRRKP
ncbi:MAG: zf-TFIIB domain-containing protein [Thermoanaerobaculum sp.]